MAFVASKLPTKQRKFAKDELPCCLHTTQLAAAQEDWFWGEFRMTQNNLSSSMALIVFFLLVFVVQLVFVVKHAAQYLLSWSMCMCVI
jgi:hypothetical protein